ncbi:glycosyltransferase family 1 protein [Novosphingobium sp.]|uniref:glycosyltransferase family 4 protein n=1 Tax=Novosphingobium sp. TaxID=1874826 RepID=UPI001DE2A9C3|nr:glycosyltransferase family 1 protein [Novosphingobium sp.]MBX9663162.1 glycosyltransferase family 4 protein [Novosphingobium sp.]
MRRVVFNGKFRAGGLNGVHRVAARLICEVDDLLASAPAPDDPPCALIVPKGCADGPPLAAIQLIEDDRPASQPWEQLRLPKLAAGGLLVNLANLAPVAHRPKLTMLHDAQFLRADSSYPWRQRMGYRLLTPLMARSSARVLTVSAFSAGELARGGVTGRVEAKVLHNGADHILEARADPAALARLGLAPRSYALMFGSPKAYKNNAVVFSAFAGGALAPLRLVVVGPPRAALEAAGLTPPPDALFAGPCDDAVLRALYEGAEALLFPSRTEGFGLPPVEAMLCGCPVIAAPCGAVPEICGDAALYADPDDPAAWRAALSDLPRSAFIAAGHARAARYTWARAGRDLLTALRELAQKA